MTAPPHCPHRPGVSRISRDDFSGPLREDLWADHYLQHWTTPDRSAARYEARPTGLRLRIDSDQLDWREEDAPLRVSNLQTGLFSGVLGSRRGTHRHRQFEIGPPIGNYPKSATLHRLRGWSS